MRRLRSRRGSTTMPELKTAGIRHGERFGERSCKTHPPGGDGRAPRGRGGRAFRGPRSERRADRLPRPYLQARAEACRRAPLCAGLRRDGRGLPAGPRRERHGARGARAAELPRHRQRLPARRAQRSADAPARHRGGRADGDEGGARRARPQGRRRHPPQPRRAADPALRRGALAGAPEERRRPRLAGRGASRGEGSRADRRRRCSAPGSRSSSTISAGPMPGSASRIRASAIS